MTDVVGRRHQAVVLGRITELKPPLAEVQQAGGTVPCGPSVRLTRQEPHTTGYQSIRPRGARADEERGQGRVSVGLAVANGHAATLPTLRDAVLDERDDQGSAPPGRIVRHADLRREAPVAADLAP